MERASKTLAVVCVVACLGGCAGDTTDSATSAKEGAHATRKHAKATEPANSEPGGKTDPTANLVSAEAAKDPKTPFNRLPQSCRGFEVAGIEHSPGGDVLPNTCAPFDGTYNNPYAIRCVDALENYESGFTGDEYCILPPPADKGTQIHVGPTSYTDAAELASFLLEPGKEINTYYYVDAPNAENHYVYRTNWRMRPGSHHMIITMMEGDRNDGWAGASEAGTDFGSLGRNFGGAQRPDQDRPQGTLAVPPENEGLALQIDAKQQFSFNLHHINTGQTPILREAWVNAWYKDESEVTAPIQSLSIFGNPADVAVSPGEHRVLHYQCDVKNDTRIVSLQGHRHANTDRFGIWVERGNEKIEAYESFDYQDMPTYQYDSVSSNPKPDVGNRVDGAHTGMLELKSGDRLHFVCDIMNRQDKKLRFANELLTGEMCIVFGSYTGEGQVCGQATRVMD
ncbi:MAG TPA: hypothetical protein VJV78_43230 [Polyangiales bacterium]|nr:hypothetical protein [Polyangiales bacterium]